MIERRERILAWRSEGLSSAEIGRRLGISGTRVAEVVRQAAWDCLLYTSPSPRDS